MTRSPATSSPVGEANLGSVLSPRERPQPPSALSASLTFGWRAVLKIKHGPQQVFEAAVFPVILTLLFTFLFGGALAGTTGDYLRTFIPGVMVMSAIMVTMYAGAALNADIAKGAFDRFRSMPIWQPAVLTGAMLGDVLRYLMASVVPFLLGLALGFRPDGGVSGVLLSLVLIQVFTFSFAWIWVSLGLRMRRPEAVVQVSSVIIFPLMLASNIFVAPPTMPSWLRAVVEVNPVSQVVTATRGLMGGTVTAWQIGWALVACAAILLVFVPIAIYQYGRKS
jgi:ABC-2 type transport system permease protein